MSELRKFKVSDAWGGGEVIEGDFNVPSGWVAVIRMVNGQPVMGALLPSSLTEIVPSTPEPHVGWIGTLDGDLTMRTSAGWRQIGDLEPHSWASLLAMYGRTMTPVPMIPDPAHGIALPHDAGSGAITIGIRRGYVELKGDDGTTLHVHQGTEALEVAGAILLATRA